MPLGTSDQFLLWRGVPCLLFDIYPNKLRSVLWFFSKRSLRNFGNIGGIALLCVGLLAYIVSKSNVLTIDVF